MKPSAVGYPVVFRGRSVHMLNKYFKSCLFALATCLIGSGAMAQSEQSKSELLEDLLSGSDVCVNLGYVSEDGVNTERLEYEKKLMSVNQQLAEALAELETIKSEAGKSNSSSVDERLDFLRDAVTQCEMKYAALSEEKNSGAENGNSDPELRQQVAELKRQLSSLQSLLNLTEEKDKQDEIQLQNLGNRLNAALARVASEERKKRQLEQSLRLELEAKLNEIEKLKAANSGLENLGKSITLYKKTVQRLLNKKKCKAGSVDGIIGNQTIRAAERFAYASNFPRKNNLVYDEGFFNHLNSSKRECKVATTSPIIGSSGIKASDILNTSKAKMAKYNNSQICSLATRYGKWDVVKAYFPYIEEAKRRGLSCGVSR